MRRRVGKMHAEGGELVMGGGGVGSGGFLSSRRGMRRAKHLRRTSRLEEDEDNDDVQHNSQRHTHRRARAHTHVHIRTHSYTQHTHARARAHTHLCTSILIREQTDSQTYKKRACVCLCVRVCVCVCVRTAYCVGLLYNLPYSVFIN